MHFATGAAWLDSFVLSSRVERSGRATEFYRAARAGMFVRLAHGVYLPSDVWTTLSSDDRFVASIHAAQRTSRRDLVFSHMLAAALWGLPLVGQWPPRPEVVTSDASGGRSRQTYVARLGSVPRNPDVVDGLMVTALGQTLVDVAHRAPLTTSVAMLDFALRAPVRAETGLRAVRVTGAELAHQFETSARTAGRTLCARALDLCDGGSGSAGESLSRVNMHLLGLPMPMLQVPFRDSRGLIGYVDFWWPQFNVIGEFDGFGKYLREELRAGRSTADVVLAEKAREDRLRALGPTVTRWGWATARSPALIGRHLREAGVA